MAGTSAGAKKGWIKRKGGGFHTPTNPALRKTLARQLKFVRRHNSRINSSKARNRRVFKEVKFLRRSAHFRFANWG